MVVLDIPKLQPDRTVQWVRVTISAGAVRCADEAHPQSSGKAEAYGGPSGADPEPDWTLARECKLWMAARIVKQTSAGGGQPPGHGVVA